MARKSRKPIKRTRGTGSIRFRKGLWFIRFREDGRRHAKSYETEDEAKWALAMKMAEIANRNGLPARRSADAPMLAELAKSWIERRMKTHRSAHEDHWRWKKHLGPFFDGMRPDTVDAARIREFIESKIGKLASSTIRLCVLELSGLFSDLVERGLAQQHPVRNLPRSTRRLIRSSHDPRTTPFVEKMEDVERIYAALPEPINVAYAIGAFAGLRTGEILALRWFHVDLGHRRIHVRESVDGPLKDDDSRIVTIQDALYGVLAAWRLRMNEETRVIPPMRSDGEHCDDHTLRAHLKAVLADLGLPRVTWYQATRHTFASQWVMAGQSIETLKEMMGHSTVQVTERYAHLKPDAFTAQHRAALKADLAPPTTPPRYSLGTIGHEAARKKVR